jgi:D-lactate dehydrogenase (cytochrome)
MMAYYDEVLKGYGLEYVIFGHMRNCHPHVEIILKDMDDLSKAKEAYGILAKRAFEFGGSPSAEHGIGKLKRDYIAMVYGEEGISQIRRVKSAFDPNNILNRGNIVE